MMSLLKISRLILNICIQIVLPNCKNQKKIIYEHNQSAIAQSLKTISNKHLLDYIYCTEKGYCSRRSKSWIKDKQTSEFSSFNFVIDHMSSPTDLNKLYIQMLSSKSRQEQKLPDHSSYMFDQT